tara:strand:+ start:585 stop:809 length:225 start_codon:yes stop_codon:yes gene_type:complete
VARLPLFKNHKNPRSIRQEKTGLLIPPKDFGKFYNTIKQLVINDDLKKAGEYSKISGKENPSRNIIKKYTTVFR